MVSERQRTNIVPNKQTSHIYLIIKSIQKTHIFIEELLSVYHFHILWKRYTDFLQLPPAGFRRGLLAFAYLSKRKQYRSVTP